MNQITTEIAKTQTEKALQAIWRNALEWDDIGVDDDYFELGGNSVTAVVIFDAIAAEFGKRLPLSTLYDHSSIAALSRAVDDFDADAAFAPLVTISAGGGRRPLFCIHAVNGQITFYFDLIAGLPADQPVFGLQYPDQHKDPPPRLSVVDMGVLYADIIEQAQPTGAVAVAGYSFGCLPAFETARQLRQRGREIDRVILFDGHAPGSARSVFHRAFLHDLTDLGGLSWHARLAAIAKIVPDAAGRLSRRAAASAKIRMRSALPHPPVIEQIESILKRAGKTYAPAVFDGDVVLFAAMESDRYWPDDRYRGWQSLVAGTITVEPVPGDHFTCFEKPHVHEISKQLRPYLDDR
jgi:thioesterase domain-containing protein/acyl carrier protein